MNSYWDDAVAEEPEYEPKYPEVDDIVDEALRKVKNILCEKCADQINGIKETEKELEKQRLNLIEQETHLRQTEIALKNAAEQLRNEKEALYEGFKAEWFSKLGIGFKPGDTVYTSVIKRTYKDCPNCKGKGEVEFIYLDERGDVRKEKGTCPKCHGTKQVLSNYYCDIQCYTVNYIRFEVFMNDGRVGYAHDEFDPYESKTRIEMTNGMCFTPDTVYHTEEEAKEAGQKKVDKANKELGVK